MEPRSVFARWRANFLTGLVVLLPAVLTLALVKWIFGTIASVTDLLLFFVPRSLTHDDAGKGPMFWHWSLAAFGLAVVLVSLAGLLARYYVGKRMIAWLDSTMLRVPLLNKIYGTIKQVNEAFGSGSKTSFKTVVLVEFPRAGMYSVGFLTSEQHAEVQAKTKEEVVCVFVPTTPNPTSGFLVLVPEDKVTRLEMSVADGIKYIISLGSVAPDYPQPGVPTAGRLPQPGVPQPSSLPLLSPSRPGLNPPS
jgi:uncharacterized membrane protein